MPAVSAHVSPHQHGGGDTAPQRHDNSNNPSTSRRHDHAEDGKQGEE